MLVGINASWSVLCFGVLCCWAIPFHRFRRQPWLFHRWNTFENASVIAVSFLFTLAQPLNVYYQLLRKDNSMNDLKSLPRMMNYIDTFVNMTSTIAAFFLFSMRVWNQYYSTMVAVKVGIAEWQSMIDESLITENTSWFLRHKNTWGNRVFIIRIVLVIWMILCILGMTLPYVCMFSLLYLSHQ